MMSGLFSYEVERWGGDRLNEGCGVEESGLSGMRLRGGAGLGSGVQCMPQSSA